MLSSATADSASANLPIADDHPSAAGQQCFRGGVTDTTRGPGNGDGLAPDVVHGTNFTGVKFVREEAVWAVTARTVGGMTIVPELRVVRQTLGRSLFGLVAGPDGPTNRARIHQTPGPRWFAEDRPIRRVHGDASMFVGGLRALLLQSLHPLAMAGVAEHSDYRGDPWGRLQRTSTFLAVTTYGTAADAQRAVDKVRGIHRRVHGVAPDGRPYHADDPHLLEWVHIAEVDSFLLAHQLYGAAPLDQRGRDGMWPTPPGWPRRSVSPTRRAPNSNWPIGYPPIVPSSGTDSAREAARVPAVDAALAAGDAATVRSPRGDRGLAVARMGARRCGCPMFRRSRPPRFGSPAGYWSAGSAGQ